MRWLWALACLAGFCQPRIIYARSMHVELHKSSLICETRKFVETTEFARLAPLSQTIIEYFKNTESPMKIDLRQHWVSYPFELGGTKGLASFVSAWQCRKTPAGHVLVLWYTCPQDLREDIPRAFCSVTGEWERYVALDGSLLDQGFTYDDTRYDALRAKLGYHDKPDQAMDEGPFIWLH